MAESSIEPASVRFPCACEVCSAKDALFEACSEAACSRSSLVRSQGPPKYRGPRFLVWDDRKTRSSPFDDSFSPVQDSESTVFKDVLYSNTLASER